MMRVSPQIDISVQSYDQITVVSSYMVYNHPSVRNHDTQYYVCNYGAAGNYNGRPVYQGGATCSACPEGTSCTDRGLCAR